MNKIKIQKIVAICSMASTLLLGASPAFGDVQTINENTGFASSNDVVATVAESFASLNENAQVIVNVGEGTVTSGGNIVAANTEGGDAVTGVVSLDGEFMNDTNVNMLNHTGSWVSDPLSENNTTGANSVNNATTTLDEAVAASNTNDANVENDTSVEAISGNNEISDNTGVGSVDTGSVDGLLSTGNVINSNFLDIMSSGAGELISAALNDTTGAGSTNDAVVTVNNTIAASNANSACVNNAIFALLSSGGNIIAANTGSADVLTGDVSGQTDVANEVNSNTTNITADLGGADVSAGNSTTGAGSVNGAAASVSQVVAVSNLNEAKIHNDVDTTALSGGNDVSNNTGPVTVGTGDAGNTVSIANAANANTTTVDLGVGGLTVGASNSTTGSGSTNNADATVDLVVASESVNSIDLNNSVVSTSCTGCNVVDGNTGSVAVDTGDASNDTAIVNDVNTNVTDITLNPTAVVSAGNDTTGANSVNGASSSVTNTIAVSNTNDASISNTVVSTSNSGGNDVSGNTGSSSVSTGSASLTFGVENTGNSNTTTVGQ